VATGLFAAVDVVEQLHLVDLALLGRAEEVDEERDAAAACGLCTQMVSPFIRIGASATWSTVGLADTLQGRRRRLRVQFIARSPAQHRHSDVDSQWV
jgi:hypothetical protein